MTKLKNNKQFVIDSLDKDKNLKKDIWNNYLFINNKTKRYKLKRNEIRIEIKINRKWFTVIHISYEDMVQLIKKHEEDKHIIRDINQFKSNMSQ